MNWIRKVFNRGALTAYFVAAVFSAMVAEGEGEIILLFGIGAVVSLLAGLLATLEAFCQEEEGLMFPVIEPEMLDSSTPLARARAFYPGETIYPGKKERL
jgi:hypothetical protein